ncbi:MAG: RNA polymerase subunit sigma-70 [Eubacteriales bacterium]|nr:RNA polymerase subunit sigma-70 [Eubacteriales bacterium]
MTSHDKDVLRDMRQAGKSYGQIAALLGISENTVKSFCRRAQIRPAPSAETLCLCCRKPLKMPSGKRQQHFCSDACRYAWHYAHRVLDARNAVGKPCAACGQPFFSFPSSHRKYCSHTCYIVDRYGKEQRHGTRAI